MFSFMRPFASIAIQDLPTTTAERGISSPFFATSPVSPLIRYTSVNPYNFETPTRSNVDATLSAEEGSR